MYRYTLYRNAIVPTPQTHHPTEIAMSSKEALNAPQLENILRQRKEVHGDITEQAQVSQILKGMMQSTPNWDNLTSRQKECLEMIQHKIARILVGVPDYIDHWDDIAGYAHLGGHGAMK